MVLPFSCTLRTILLLALVSVGILLRERSPHDLAAPELFHPMNMLCCIFVRQLAKQSLQFEL